ncbi:MAG TPA: non-ribosomal peptide synthase/polyketide synthase [Thermoanaerobaculia bacterium]|nr:non-ribosomal peptide synthase/polyketide synthase [Thermoanaerobaculia bacterium]
MKEALANLSPEKRALLMLRLKKKKLGEARSGIGPRPDRSVPAPLSFAQERLWFLSRLGVGAAYNEQKSVRLEGALDVGSLGAALDEIRRRHEVLRTVFRSEEGPVQVVSPWSPRGLAAADLSGLPASRQDAEIDRLTRELAGLPFDLEREAPLRVALLRLGEREGVLSLTMHHVATDGWSWGVLLRELGTLYEAFAGGVPSPLPELALQYSDFAVWQRERLSEEEIQRQIGWWRERLEGAPEVLELPTDRPRPARKSFRGASLPFHLPEGLGRELFAFCQGEQATLFMGLMAVFQALLGRWSGQPAVLVGTPVAGRTQPEIEPLIGLFINTLVMRADLAEEASFRDLLAQVRARVLEAFAHQEAPFDHLVREVAPSRSLAHTPIFQAMLVLQNQPRVEHESARLRITPLRVRQDKAKFDLAVNLSEPGQGAVSGTWEYDRDLFDATTVCRLQRGFEVLLRGALAQPGKRLAGLPLLSATELHQILGEWGGGDRPGVAASWLDLFAAQVRRTPEARAAVADGRVLTYAELSRRAERLARHLCALGVGPEIPVALALERSPELIVAILAVLKVGGAYVPLDPSYPRERLSLMLEDSRAAVGVTERRLADALPAAPGAGWLHLDLDDPGDAVPGPSGDVALPRRAARESLAYVIYTSGSTGRPKGVMVSHAGLANLGLAVSRLLGIEPGDRVLQFASPSFDTSVYEIFSTLLAGAEIHLAGAERLLPSDEGLGALLAERGITQVTLTPSALAVLPIRDFPALRTLAVAGESCPPDLARRWLAAAPARRLVDAYGPTEVTVCATAGEVTPGHLSAPGARPSIGRPITGARVAVLDRSLAPVPAGVPGEMCLGGIGLARGYLGRPDLTAGRFVPDPFAGSPGVPAGGRLYRTGDLARWLPDGRLDFLGRVDHQVKVRGFRIEPGEIEAALGAVPGVREAAVAVRGEGPAAGLVAWVVPEEGRSLVPAELRRALREHLPEHMVPGVWMILDALPLLPNDKVDRLALPDPGQDRGGAEEGIEVWGELERAVAAIWEEVLHRERIGRGDDFFELGGHSLLATQIVSRVRQVFGVELPLRALFEEPTVAESARFIERSRAAGVGPEAPPVLPVPRDRDLPLSFAQERLWFLDRLVPDNPFYNIPGAVRLTGALDVRALRHAFAEIVRRHEGLRTTFSSREGRPPVQVISPPGTEILPRVELGSLPPERARGELRRLAAEERLRPFDLARGPLFRATLAGLGAEDHTLLVSLHHVIADGWSAGILNRELVALYGAFAEGVSSPLPELPVQYADFAVWQRQWLQGDVLRAQLDYWESQLADLPEMLELPCDHPRPSVERFRGATVSARLSAALGRGLGALARGSGATRSMAVLAGFSALLARAARREDLPVGMAIANRTRREIEGLIGFFVNSLVLRNRVPLGTGEEAGFAAFLGRVRETALDAFAHQDLPFEKLVEELHPERDLGRNPLIQVMFSWQSFPRSEARIQGLTLSPLDGDGGTTGTSKFDLTLFLHEQDGEILAVLEHNSDLFEAATARRLLGHLETLLAAAVAAPESPVAELPLLSAAERQQLLREWSSGAVFPAEESLAELFEAQVRRTPEATALRFEGLSLSYAELNRRANRLAHLLRRSGVGRESRVGLCAGRTPGLVVGILGILKAGGAYVPLDPDYPRERLAFLIGDAGPRVLVAEENALAVLPEPAANGGPEVVLLDDRETLEAFPAEDPPPAGGGDAIAYVIYTSGSTGRPKGVLVSHADVVRLMRATEPWFAFGPDDVWTLFHSYAFDFSVWELWGALAYGGRLVVVPYEVSRSPEEFCDLLESERVTVLNQTPSAFRQLMAADAARPRDLSLRSVIFGGEALDPRSLAPWIARRGDRRPRLVNMYGITETTVHVTYRPLDRSDMAASGSPIGRPIPDLETYVLDACGQPSPLGVPGEIFVGGAGLARGYLDRPALSAERFLPDPFSGRPGARLYRTGDLARVLPDGQLEHLGRIDHQVKVRGFRIELGEIEAVLREHEAVRDAAVLARGDSADDQRLVAYVVQAPEQAAGESGAKDEQVSQWAMVFDDTYGKDAPEADPTFNIIGWDSTYTGEPIPRDEMAEWLEDTVERILALPPGRVLEIGCGTGLLLFRIAPESESYVGTDLSRQAIAYLEGHLGRLDDPSRVRLLARPADRLDGLAPDSFDTLILNSVAQYFPSLDYLLEVVAGAVEVVRPGGAVFLGDLRSLPLLEAFHTSVELFRAEPDLPLARLRQRVQTRRQLENELVVSPALFTALRRRLPKIGRVEIHPKRGQAHNELTGFRYQVVLRLGEAPPAEEVPWLDWRLEGLTLDALRGRLEREADGVLGVRSVPNARVAAAAAAARLLLEDEAATAGELRQRAAAAAAGAVDPQALWDLGSALGWEVELGWASPGSDGSFEAVLRRRGSSRPSAPLASLLPPALPGPASRPWSSYANQPMQGRFARRMAPELRAFLAARLPDHMVPAAFVLLDELPLTAHGKVDRRRLPAPEVARPDGDVPYVAPRTPTEERLAAIYAELLGVDRVGAEDDFFALGGHSLLATQVVSRVRHELAVELPLRTLFERPRVAGLAAAVDALGDRGEPLQAPPILPAPRGGEIPLSFAQQRLWFLDQLEPGSAVYDIFTALSLTGALDAAALAASLSAVSARHEALRTTFGEREGRPFQRVHPATALPLPVVDLAGLDDREREARRLAEEEARRPFDLARGPLLRCTLLRLGATEHWVLLNMHHIVSDGWSMGLLVREVGACYGALCRGERPSLPALPVQYADFALWQRSTLSGRELERQLAWWRERLAGAPALLDLPLDRPRPAVQSYRGAHLPARLPQDLSAALASLARERGATLFVVLLAGFQALLGRLSGQEDLVVGSPVANRNRLETEGLIGFFVNTLALRVGLGGDPVFVDLIGRVREVALAAYAHQDLPFERLVEELQPERSLAQSPFFQVMFVLQNAPLGRLDLPGLTLAPVETEPGGSKFDLTLSLREGPRGLTGFWELASDLLDAATVVRWAGQLERLLAGALERPEARLSELPLLSWAERHQLLLEWNDSAAGDGFGCVHELFERQAVRTPEAVAAFFAGEALTYRELDRRSGKLAAFLRRRGVGTDSVVALHVERSLEMVVGVLGILRAGAGYLPLDPAYPADRLAFMLADAAVPLLLTEERLEGTLPAGQAAVVRLDADWEEIEGAPDLPPAGPVSDLALGYVIYTSGSTGRPKGVALAHRPLRNLLDWHLATLLGGARTLQFASLSFDASFHEMFAAWGTGGSVAIVPEELRRDIPALAGFLVEARIEKAILPVVVLQQLAEEYASRDELPPWREVTTTGEQLQTTRAMARLFERLGGCAFHNHYGPSESHVVTAYTLEADPARWRSHPPIGRPISNTTIHLLDRSMSPVGLGVLGELYIGGECLARGYLGRPDLTAERFVPDPFAAEPGGRLYRTGDKVRRLSRGDVEFLGRFDHQVKIRGFRVEPGEVEAILGVHPAVREVVVVVQGEGVDRRLAAFVVPASETAPPGLRDELRTWVRERLPSYMVPAAFTVLPAFPLTPSGKVDRRKLSLEGLGEDGAPGAERDYVAPRTPVEELLAGIFAQVLRRERVGAEGDFFALGGHSLLATQVTSRVRAALGIELPLRTLFEEPRVAPLAARLESLLAAGQSRHAPPIRPVPRGAGLPLSFAQERLWFLDQLDSGTAANNLAMALELRGPVDPEAVAASLREIVARHEVLRTTFAAREGRPVQTIAPPPPVALPLADLSGLPSGDREDVARSLARQLALRPFDLARGPLLRVALLRLDPDRHVALFAIHHIACDGWSLGILVEELAALYPALRGGGRSPLPGLPVQYADFAAWQRAWLSGEVLREQLAWWRGLFDGPPSVLDLPLDRPLPAVQSFRGAQLPVQIPADLSRRLAALARESGATPFMVLLAGFQTLLARLSGQEDVVVGSPVANRNRVETEGLIGFFVNTLPLRGRPSGDLSFAGLLARTRETALGAYAHQDLPFERLVEELAPERSLAHAPLFQVMLVLQNAPARSLELPGLTLTPFPFGGAAPLPFALSLALSEAPAGHAGLLEYSPDLFDRSTVERLWGHLTGLLAAAAASPGLRLSELPLLSAAEEHQLLAAWSGAAALGTGPSLLHEPFETQAGLTPQALALVGDGGTLTYGELDRQANRLARHLRELGVGPEAVVGVCAERSPDLILALLAVLKAGGAYLPLDPGYPRERLAWMLEDARVPLLLADSGSLLRLAEQGGRRVILLDRDGDWQGCDAAPLPPAAGTGHAAYLMYTSGSTGRPKGILVEHRSASWYAAAARDGYRLTAADRVLQFASPSFDISVEEIFPTLGSGAALVLASPDMLAPARFLERCRDLGVSVVSLPTAFWHALVPEIAEQGAPLPPSLRLVILGGEKVLAARVEPWRRSVGPRIDLVNTYGPTETTVAAALHRIGAADGPGEVPIGRPIPGARLYVLDRGLALLPAGVPGELYIGGPGVARGYPGRPDLTAERFLPDACGGVPGARLYRTGDRMRWLPGGLLEFLGRVDEQVKVRGFRVEPGEIESVLTTHPQVGEAAVAAQAGPSGEVTVVAWVAPVPGADLAIAELRRYLRERLPDYMVPAAFVPLQRLPRLPAGKVDRRALPAPERTAAAVLAPPRTGLEREIARVWREVLGVASVGVDDNFFDLGGHSLRLVEVQARLRRDLGREVSLVELFQYPTIGSLAVFLDPGREIHAQAPDRSAIPAGETAVAVIGMSGRFPGAAGLEELWANLRAGIESIATLSDEELLAAGVRPELLAAPGYVKACGALDGIDLFDAGFFGFSPREAETLDPQHRLFLECSWHALENAGYDPRRAPGAVGVFASSQSSRYVLNLLSRADVLDTVDPWGLAQGLDKDFLPTRVSYELDLKGPSVAVQTACSSSLVAVHFACRALLQGDCDMALAGGVAIQVPHRVGYLWQEGGISSPDGQCRAFEARALGTVPGSGVGVVVLKRLAAALRDGDTIHAVVRGSAVNNDGALKVGYTAPSVEGQADVIAAAQASAGVEPGSVQYVEAHGTATPLGDPVEVAALTRAFRAGTGQTGFCALGSVKTNIGHLDTAAGIAGFLKAVLALENRQIPPSLHFEQPNPKIDFAASPFYVNARLSDWAAPEGGGSRRAGVSSFGIGGTNAHVVLEEAPPAAPSSPSRPFQLLLLSARTPAALEEATGNLAAFLTRHKEADLADVAYTLQVGRRAFEHRRMVVCESDGEGAARLALADPERVSTRHRVPGRRQVVFLFPGQGAQHPGMARELYTTEAVFRRELDVCAERLRLRLGRDLRDLLFATPAREAEAAGELRHTRFAQPALFAVEHALARLWLSWGLRPAALLGHSVGEYVAACLAGVLSLEEALDLVALRGELIGELPPGAMLAVELPENELTPRLAAVPAVAVAAVNGPSTCVISGPEDAVATMAARLAEEGVSSRPLHTSHAFHSAALDPILDRFADEVGRISLRAPSLPYLSNLTGTWITDAEATDPRYWARHLRGTVRFGDAVARLLADAPAEGLAWLEVGPGRTLSSLVRRHLGPGSGHEIVASMRHARGAEPDGAVLLEAAGRLWLTGVEIDWAAYHSGERRRRVPLPGYPFERRRYWVEPRRTRLAAAHRSMGTGDVAARTWRKSPLPGARPPGGDGTWVLVPASPARRSFAEALGGLLKAAEQPAIFAPEALEGISSGARIVYLAGPEGETEPGGRDLLGLLRDLAARGGPPASLTLVSEGLQSIAGESRLAGPERAALLGLCRTASRSLPETVCRHIDILLPHLGREERLARRIASELLSGAEEPFVAWRSTGRWVEALEPLPAGSGEEEPRLRQGGVCLLGGVLPVALAEILERDLAARLAVASSDPGELRRAVGRVRAELGALDAVLWGVGEGSVGPELAALEAALEGEELDLCAVLSPEADEPAGVAAAAVADVFVRGHNERDPEHPWLRVSLDGWDGEPTSLNATEELGRALRRWLALDPEDGPFTATVRPSTPATAEPAAAPETPSGHDRPDLGTPYLAPRGATEERLARIWQALLGIDRIGVHDDFFELGGHSLLATRVMTRVRGAFGLEIPLEALFEAPTVARLAARIETLEAGSAGLPVLARVPRAEDLPLSFAQQQIWVLQHLEPWSPAYNLPSAFRLRGALAPTAIAWGLERIVERHEVLRTTFPAGPDGWPLQRIADRPDFNLSLVDLVSLGEEGRDEARALGRRESLRPFDLARGPLLRALLVRLAPDDHVLYLNAHHICFDGWSWGVLLGELAVLYAAFRAGRPSPLPSLPVQYADFAVWQRRRAHVLEEHLGYWKEHLAGQIPLLLAPERPRRNDGGAAEDLVLPADLTESLRALGQREGCTPFMVLLALFKILLYQRSGRDDVSVGSPVAGRVAPEVEGLVGNFVNTVVLRTRLDPEMSFGELLARVRETALGAQAHQEVPFEQVAATMREAQGGGRGRLFEVWFVVHNTPGPGLSLPGLAVSGAPVEGAAVRHDLSLSFWEGAQGWRGTLDYRPELFAASWAQRLAEDFVALARAVSHDARARVETLAAALAQAEQEWQQARKQVAKTAGLDKLRAARRKAV